MTFADLKKSAEDRVTVLTAACEADGKTVTRAGSIESAQHWTRSGRLEEAKVFLDLINGAAPPTRAWTGHI